MAAARFRLALAFLTALSATGWWVAARTPLAALVWIAALGSAAAQIVIQTRRVAIEATWRARDAAAFERLRAALPDGLLQRLERPDHAAGTPREAVRRLHALWELRTDPATDFLDPELAQRRTALLRAVNDYVALVATETVGDDARFLPLDPTGAREASTVARRLDSAARRVAEKHLQLRDAVRERTGAGAKEP